MTPLGHPFDRPLETIGVAPQAELEARERRSLDERLEYRELPPQIHSCVSISRATRQAGPWLSRPREYIPYLAQSKEHP